MSRLGIGLDVYLCLVTLVSIMFRFRFIVLHYFRSSRHSQCFAIVRCFDSWPFWEQIIIIIKFYLITHNHTYSANTRAIAELQKASPTCSVNNGKAFDEWKQTTCKSDAASPGFAQVHHTGLVLDLDHV